jgi:hypothetical protein
MTGRAPRPWTINELTRARAMRANGESYAKIDAALGRRVGSTQGKFDYLATEKQRSRPDDEQLPGLRLASTDALADREARREAADRRDLTAATFGDPAPGYSALDRRRLRLVKPTEAK